MFDIKQLDNAYNPAEQLLIALGVHPDQQSAKDTVLSAIKPEAPAKPSDVPTAPPIARPNNVRPVNLPMGNDPRLGADQAEVERLNKTGSGISQIHNPVLRTIARIGDIAGSSMFPGITAHIPGTELHHRSLLNEAEGKVNQDLGEDAKQAQIGHTQAETEALENKPTAEPKPFFDQAGDLIGFQMGEELFGPNSPKLTPDMRDMMAATKGKAAKEATPESQAFSDLIKQGKTPLEAYQELQKSKAEAKPPKEQNQAEKLKQEIAAAFESGDHETVKKKQAELKAIDPMGAERLTISLQGLGLREQNATRQDVREHDKAYVQPAEVVEKSYQMMDHAYREYKDAQAQGKELPTGAQSMLALSTHLSTTFGNVKGARVTKDMIEHHLGARSISDSALVAIQKLTNGDVLSPDQWEAFHDLIKQSRDLSWKTAVKEANRKKVPVDFLPDDLSESGTKISGNDEAIEWVRDASGKLVPKPQSK